VLSKQLFTEFSEAVVIALMSALVLGVLLLGTAALSGQPGAFLVAAAVAVAVVLFLTRRSGLLARRRARER